MSRITLIAKDSNDEFGKDRKIEITFEAITLPDVIEEFEYFLKSIGYVFTGKLDIVEDDTYTPDQENE